MAKLFVVRHAEKAVASRVEDGMHAGITMDGRKNARRFGTWMKDVLENQEVAVIPSMLERCKQTAFEFFVGYGERASVLGAGRRGGEITYIIPEMVSMAQRGGSHSAIVSRLIASGPFSALAAEIFSNFESDYPKTMTTWLRNGFNGKLITPHAISDAIMKIADMACSEIVLMFVSDIQISSLGVLNNIPDVVEKRPDCLTGLWDNDFPKGDWSVFRGMARI
jgi:hypothetical protein